MGGQACTRELLWYYHAAVSLVSFFGGLVVLTVCRLFWYALCRRTPHNYGKPGETDTDWSLQQMSRFHCFSRIRACFSKIRAQATSVLSGHSTLSKAVIVFFWLVNMASIVLYLVEATQYSVAECGPVIGNPTQYTWIAFSAVFIVHYIIRFVAAADKCFMWMDLYSIVDHFTIAPLFVCFYFNRNWLGLKFLRLLHLLRLPSILQLTHTLKSRSSIRLTQVAAIFISIWLCSSGFVHLSENNGDPHKNYSNPQVLTYWACVYWLLVTMSTVGFGEISPSTDISRAFIVIFIMGSFAMFSSIIPELVRNLGRKSKYHKPYKRTYRKKHIVVCGHITRDTVSGFIKNFIHEDAESANIDVVFVDMNKPELELEAFFKRHFNDVKFVQGTVMDLKTLQGVKLRSADACLIIANRGAENPDAEDAANTMRATAIKNFYPRIRVIIQILQYRNKMNLLHIPNWHWDQIHGDEVICISELRNGILAQNCLAPGISTLLANLFTNRSAKKSHSSEWTDLYKIGAGNEIYAEHFSKAFYDMRFTKAASVCFSKLGLLLVACHERRRNKAMLKVNPGDKYIINSNSVGFFIAQSPDDVKRVTTYSHGDAYTVEYTNATNSFGGKSGERPYKMEPITSGSQTESHESTYLEYQKPDGKRHRGSMVSLSISEDGRPYPEILDITGMLHWSPSNPIEDCVMDCDSIRDYNFRNHVILCLSASDNSPEVGLVNFIMPLRASSIRASELKDVVILGNIDHIRQEWDELANFPRVYLYPQSRHSRLDLRAVNLQYCDMCVIMTAGRPIMVDETLIDKEAVLTTLTIKSMFGNRLEARIQSVGVLTNPEVFRRDVAVAREIPIITELEHDANVSYVDPDEEVDPSVPVHLTTPYVCGRTLVSSVLDSLVSCTYLNGNVLTLIRALVTGGETAEFENILSEGLGIVRKNTLIDVTASRERSRLGQMSLSYGPLEKLQHNNLYGELFMAANSTYHVVCLGLYRLIDPKSRDQKRVVITNPAYDVTLQDTDRVFVLQPYNLRYEYPTSDSHPTSDSQSSLSADNDTRHNSVMFTIAPAEDSLRL